MKNDNLRNKLNQIPQDFDREELWSKIELPKRKSRKRRFLWIWLSGTFFFLFCCFIWKSNYYLEQGVNDEVQTKNSIISEPLNQIPELKTEEIHDNNINESEANLLTTTSNNDSNLLGDEPHKTNQDKDSDVIFISLENDSGNPKVASKRSNSEVQNYGALNGLNIINHNNGKSSENINSKTLEAEAKIVMASSLSIESIKRNNEWISSPQKVKSIFSMLEHQVMIKYPFVNNSESTFWDQSSPSKTKWSVGMVGLYGQFKQDFESSNQSINRALEERALESITTGFFGNLDMQKIQLSAGLSYSKYNTQITKNIQDYAVINNGIGLNQKTLSAKYSLFNTYSILDINIGVGYRVLLSNKWNITPSLLLGYSLGVNAKGEYFDNDDNLIVLNDLLAYNNFGKWFGGINVKIDRDLGNNFNVGFLVFANTNRRIGSFIDYEHNIMAYGAGISLSRIISN